MKVRKYIYIDKEDQSFFSTNKKLVDKGKLVIETYGDGLVKDLQNHSDRIEDLINSGYLQKRNIISTVAIYEEYKLYTMGNYSNIKSLGDANLVHIYENGLQYDNKSFSSILVLQLYLTEKGFRRII